MAIFTADVVNGADDGFQQGNSVMDTTNAFYVYAASTNIPAAVRFRNVTIPKSSTITSATMTVITYDSNYDSPNVQMHCHASDNSPTLGTGNGYISGLSLTSAYGVWNEADIGAGSRTTADFSAAVQEVVNRAGWASGNALTVVFIPYGGTVRFRSYEFGGTKASISITYTEPSGGGGVIYYAMMGG